MLYNRSFTKDCLVSRNPEADFQHACTGVGDGTTAISGDKALDS